MHPIARNTMRLARRTAAALGMLCMALLPSYAQATMLAPINANADASLAAVPATAPVRGYPPDTHLRAHQPHPAVARIIVPEGDATSYGSGTLVDVRDQFGLVVTNWHVVRDGKGDVEVLFPDGFRSKARPLKVDPDWDLAALVIWRPPIAPVAMASEAPRSGDQLTICGYGQGQYRAITGRCTQYYSPRVDFPQHMVELDVEARQGDSGGPIFNERGELAGVLFGAGRGTTLGSFGGQVGSFLATLAPDIGRATNNALVDAGNESPCSDGRCARLRPVTLPSETCGPNGCPCRNGTIAAADGAKPKHDAAPAVQRQPAERWTEASNNHPADDGQWGAASQASNSTMSDNALPAAPPAGDWTDDAKTILAAIGALTLVVQVVRAVG